MTGNSEDKDFSELKEEYGGEESSTGDVVEGKDISERPDEDNWQRAARSGQGFSDIDSEIIKDRLESEDAEPVPRSGSFQDTEKLIEGLGWNYDMFSTVERRQRKESSDLTEKENFRLKMYEGNAGVIEIFDNESENISMTYDIADSAQPANEYTHGLLYTAAQKLSEYEPQVRNTGIKIQGLKEEDIQEVANTYTLIDETLEK